MTTPAMDPDCELCQAARFTEWFVRPRGRAASVTPIVAEEIEKAARIRKRPQQRSPLWH